MNAALRAFIPTTPLPDPTISPLERVILDEHPVELVTRATDIENECEHGNLPFDPNLDCECWTRARTAALLGQAPLDDGCPGLDQAAAFDLPIPQIEASGQAADEMPAADGDVVEIHEFYLRDEQGLGSTAERFGMKRAQVRELFEAHGLELKDPRRAWQARSRKIFATHVNDQEVKVHTSHNGTEATSEPFGPTAQEIHAWYMEDDARTIGDVCEHFSLSSYKVKHQFEAAGLACKPRGGSRPRAVPQTGSGAPGFGGPMPDEAPEPEIQATVPETPIDGIAAAKSALVTELLTLDLRRSKVADAIEALDALAA